MRFYCQKLLVAINLDRGGLSRPLGAEYVKGTGGGKMSQGLNGFNGQPDLETIDLCVDSGVTGSRMRTVWSAHNRRAISGSLSTRRCTVWSPVSGWVKSLQLSFSGHLARTAPDEDYRRVIAAALRPPADWRRPVGRPRTTWLRTVDDDLQSLNFSVHTPHGLEEDKR